MNRTIYLAAAFALAACSDDTAAELDRNAVLRDLSENVLLPEVRDFDADARALSTATAALCEAPSTERLTAARDAWRSARRSWERAQVFRAGPMETLRTPSAVDWYPVDAAAVEALIAGSDPITASSIESVGANRRGLPGVEVVLFANVDVGALRDASGPSRRCQYLVAATGSVSTAAAALATAWEPSGGRYARAFATAGQGSGPAIATTREAVDAVVNQLIAALDALQVSRLAAPNGSRNGGTPEPSRATSIPSGNSSAELVAAFEGARALYTGDLDDRRGMGVTDIVASRSASLDATVRAQFDAAARALAAITLPVDRAVLEERPRVTAAIAALTSLKRTVRVDVANTLGVTVGFTDNDGD